MIYFVVPRDQEFGIQDYLESWGRGLVGRLSVVHYEDLPARSAVPAGTYIFSALDQLTPGGRRLISELQDQLRASPNAGPVLNDPRSALLRFELLEELHRRGLNPHRALRAGTDFHGLRFPVFLREEIRHTGSLSPLLRSRAQLERALGRAMLQGYRLEELLMVEFCDTVDAHGFYRKYSAYVVGSEIIARGMARGRGWMLKAEGTEFSESMLLEERAYVLANPYEPQLRRIFDLAGIRFGRIDYAIQDGGVVTWEINLNPTIGPSRHDRMPKSFGPMRQPIRAHFNHRFYAALDGLDTAATSSLIPVSYSAECRRSGSRIVRPPPTQGALVRIAKALHPMRPLFDGAVRFIAPFVARAARRFR